MGKVNVADSTSNFAPRWTFQLWCSTSLECEEKSCLLQCFSWEASAAVDSAVSHLLSTSDSSSLALPLLLPVWTRLFLIHTSALPSFPFSGVCVLLSFILPVYADPLLITVSMTAAAGRLSRGRHCWFFTRPAIRKFNDVGWKEERVGERGNKKKKRVRGLQYIKIFCLF